jgi:hypothetical protein
MTKETMFKLIVQAVKELQKKSNISEDEATNKILDGMRAMPIGSVDDKELFVLMLKSVIELELN